MTEDNRSVIVHGMDLRDYLLAMPVESRVAFATACGTTWPHLRNVIYGLRPCSERLAMAIERQSAGTVRVESLCPDADWAVVRGAQPPAVSA